MYGKKQVDARRSVAHLEQIDGKGSEMSVAEIADYAKKRPVFDALSQEVKRIIELSFAQSNTRCHSVDARAKSIDSFERKIGKLNEDGSPKYRNPLEEVTDLAGVRVITYTLDDLSNATDFVEANFSILEKRDVGEERVEQGQFGYQSIHYLAKLTDSRLSLPEFSHYRNLICEIQVRTVLQHAWAEMEHDIQYKGSRNIPKSAKRKFLSLAGLLEIADREFSSIQREDKDLKKSVLSDLQKDLTRDTIGRSGDRGDAGTEVSSSGEGAGPVVQVRSLLAAGKYREAIAIYDEKIKLEPLNYTLLIGRARAFFLAGETERALSDLEQAHELHPGDAAINSLRARISDGTLSQPVNVRNDDANLRVKTGDKHLADGEPEEAYLAYAEAQTMGASWPFTTFKLALASAVAGDVTGAELHLGELKLNPGTPMEINIVALRAILSALQRDEDFPNICVHLKSLIDEKGDFRLEMSPLALVVSLDRDKYWQGQSDKVAQVFEAMK